MTPHHPLRLALGLLLVTGIGAFWPAAAAQRGVEADRIGLGGGKVVAQGCERCPLELSADDNTRFYFSGAEINRGQAEARSGQAGTVIYDRESKRVIEIRW